jgi:hypothetical protein
MRLHLLFENVNNSVELRDAFNSEQWLRIANYFITDGPAAPPRWKGSMGENNDQIISLMGRINRQIGKNMVVQTTGQWNTVAARYGMDYKGGGLLSWNAIYNHLKPWADAPMPENFDVRGSSVDRGDIDNTRETRNEISNWVNTTTTEWTDYQAAKAEFLKPWALGALHEHRPPEWHDWLGGQTEGGNDNIYKDRLVTIGDTIEEHVRDNGSISKDEIVRMLYGWLTSTDLAWENYQENQSDGSN